MAIGYEYKPSSLTAAIVQWRTYNPLWHLRVDPVPVDGWQSAQLPNGPARQATIEEVARELVDNPMVRAGLEAIDTPLSQAIEEAVAQVSLPPWQSELLVAALRRASEIALNERRAPMRRLGALIGVGLLVAFLVLTVRAGKTRY